MKALTLATVLCLFASSLSVDPLCVGVPTGEIYLFPYPGDCSRYYECLDGTQIAQNCPSGEWFNEALQGCDHPDTSGCINVACPPGLVDFFPIGGDCTQYLECYNGNLETHSCPDDLWFNAQEKRCTSVEQSNCGPYTSEGPTYTPAPSECAGVLPGFILLKPYPGDCNKFIECLGSAMTVMSCPPYLYFDFTRQMCDQKELSDCDDTTGAPPTIAPTATPPPEGFDDPRCADGNNDYWPDVECSKFIECWQGHGYAMDCPSGLYFNEDTIQCVDPSLSGCGRTTGLPQTTPSDPDWTYNPYCPYPTPDRYLYAYPGDCTKFLECITGEIVAMDCPAGLWFNPTVLVCDYPYEAGCIYARELPEKEE